MDLSPRFRPRVERAISTPPCGIVCKLRWAGDLVAAATDSLDLFDLEDALRNLSGENNAGDHNGVLSLNQLLCSSWCPSERRVVPATTRGALAHLTKSVRRSETARLRLFRCPETLLVARNGSGTCSPAAATAAAEKRAFSSSSSSSLSASRIASAFPPRPVPSPFHFSSSTSASILGSTAAAAVTEPTSAAVRTNSNNSNKENGKEEKQTVPQLSARELLGHESSGSSTPQKQQRSLRFSAYETCMQSSNLAQQRKLQQQQQQQQQSEEPGSTSAAGVFRGVASPHHHLHSSSGNSPAKQLTGKDFFGMGSSAAGGGCRLSSSNSSSGLGRSAVVKASGRVVAGANNDNNDEDDDGDDDGSPVTLETPDSVRSRLFTDASAYQPRFNQVEERIQQQLLELRQNHEIQIEKMRHSAAEKEQRLQAQIDLLNQRVSQQADDNAKLASETLQSEHSLIIRDREFRTAMRRAEETARSLAAVEAERDGLKSQLEASERNSTRLRGVMRELRGSDAELRQLQEEVKVLREFRKNAILYGASNAVEAHERVGFSASRESAETMHLDLRTPGAQPAQKPASASPRSGAAAPAASAAAAGTESNSKASSSSPTRQGHFPAMLNSPGPSVLPTRTSAAQSIFEQLASTEAELREERERHEGTKDSLQQRLATMAIEAARAKRREKDLLEQLDSAYVQVDQIQERARQDRVQGLHAVVDAAKKKEEETKAREVQQQQQQQQQQKGKQQHNKKKTSSQQQLVKSSAIADGDGEEDEIAQILREEEEAKSAARKSKKQQQQQQVGGGGQPKKKK